MLCYCYDIQLFTVEGGALFGSWDLMYALWLFAHCTACVWLHLLLFSLAWWQADHSGLCADTTRKRSRGEPAA